MTSFLAFLGVAAGLTFIIADVPYIRDIFRGKTKPHRVSWAVYVLLNAINFANQYASGAGNSLWLFFCGTLITSFVFVLSLKYGVGGREKTDWVVIFGVLIGLLGWIVFSTPKVSIIMNLIVVSIALIPTFIKSYRHPGTETSITYLIAGVSEFIAAVSVGKFDFWLIVLPLHGFIVQVALYFLIEQRKKKVGTKPSI
jgi:uncharacterized membrane protein HdeD (DUF308 family)